MFVGIDISKATLDLAMLPSGEQFTVNNDADGIRTLLERFNVDPPELIVFEPSGGYELAVLIALTDAAQPVAMVDAKRIREFIRSTGQRAKSDALDALGIARFAQNTHLTPTVMPEVERRELEHLVTRRAQITAMLVAEKNRLALAPPLVQPSVRAHIAFLEDQRKDVDHQLEARIENSSVYRALSEVLRSVPGVGVGTATALVAMLPELGVVSRGQITALVGLAPYVRQSGVWRGKSFISGGRAAVRCVLYMATLSARRHNAVIGAVFERLRAKGKPFKVCMVACMRRLLLVLHAVARSGERFDAARGRAQVA